METCLPPRASGRRWRPRCWRVAYFLGGLLLFCVRCAIKGVPRDAETLTRGKSVLVGFFLRHYFFWVIQPLWQLLLRSGLPANALSMLSGLLGVSSGVAVAAGRFALGGWLFLAAGILDVMDGRVARTRKEANPAGAALDSVLDRYVDSAMLMGLAWYYRDTWVLLPALVAFLGSSLVPYVRAKGEGLGVSVRDGAHAAAGAGALPGRGHGAVAHPGGALLAGAEAPHALAGGGGARASSPS